MSPLPLLLPLGQPPSSHSTLVLTSPLKNFIDIRVLLPTSPILDPPRLEWAFAGTSHSTPASAEEDKPAHTVWEHWVDSKVTNAEEVKDEGDMFLQDNGEVLESGIMVNPETGEEEKYEECWVDLDLQGEKVGWALKMEDGEKGSRGIAIRIGRWIEGIIRQGEKVGVARWRYKDDEGGTGWIREVAIGRFDFPERMFGKDSVEVGKCFEGMKGEVWKVMESFTWN
ncbi:hypothetical protein BGZ57DRAFT_385977 [Hyaloscypha finlandica]|nr:hypothetical protein BGZ57DRAFT_385977 [Hyaloscypha finlandica]